MLPITEKSKLTFHWRVTPYDYSKERLNSIIAKASKKYSVPKDKIRVVPEFVMVDDSGSEISVNGEIVQNIQDKDFQYKLFQDYVKINGIEGCDFDLIKKIDSEINAKIDYQVYDKYRRYSIKWLKWDNFLSYGSSNYFDFTTLKGLVLLSGEPANQSGKTTFGVDLMHFLLFGKTDKADVQSKIFNKHLPEATTVSVEGCLEIDGELYVIKRTLSRPALGKRTEKSKVIQKVEYYKIVGDSQEELVEYVDNQQEENSVQTNKVIKEAIGRESDFDLVMSITESNLDDLIDKKDTERGRLLARWIGLLPLEEKDALAREKFNGSVKPSLLSNMYNAETLKQECVAYKTSIENCRERIKSMKEKRGDVESNIEALESLHKTLMASKRDVNTELLKVDISTLKAEMEQLTNDGKKKKYELESAEARIKEIGDVDFSVDKYDAVVNEMSDCKEKRAALLEKHKHALVAIDTLEKSQYCPMCHRKLDNVDNAFHIAEQKKLVEEIISEGKSVSKKISELESTIESMKTNRELYNEKASLNMRKAALELNLNTLRGKLRDKMLLKSEYDKNSESIDANNALDIKIRNNEVVLRDKRQQREVLIRDEINAEAQINDYEKQINTRLDIIKKIEEEAVLVKNWKIYLDMVGKNGISKMVLRKTLPIINAKIAQLLSDVCDFDVEVGINVRNDVMFYLVKDGVKSDLTSGSGLERTLASLALRSVLADLSTVPRMTSALIDEVTGRVAQENLEYVHRLLEKIVKNYDHVFIISHLEEVKNWADSNIVIKKENNISKVALLKKK